jgi:predicted dehydrogenase
MPQTISCSTSIASNLSIDTESVADIIFNYNNSLTAHLHLNYIDKPTKRNITMRFSNGRIDYDIVKNILLLYRGYSKENEPEIFDYNDKFTRNDLFELELEYFLESLNNNNKPSPSFEDGVNVLRLAIAASESAKLSKNNYKMKYNNV